MLSADDSRRHALLVADTGAGKTWRVSFRHSRHSRHRGWVECLLPTVSTRSTSRRSRRWRTTFSAISWRRWIGLAASKRAAAIRHPDRKARQRARPPHVLLTTPESLSLLLSYPEAQTMFAGLQRIVIDEVHAFAAGKRAICWRWR
jgi:ATP-dependent Lhr-like helicase